MSDLGSFITCSLQTIHLMDSTMEEDESYLFLQEYQKQKFLYHKYRFPTDYSNLEDVVALVNSFTFFYAKIFDSSLGKNFSTNFPLGVFRFVLLEDLSFSAYYSVRRQPGFIVEGAYWSNGMFYQVRQDAKEDFEVYEVTLMIDTLTRNLHSFPKLRND